MADLDPAAYDRFAVVAIGTPEVVAAVEHVRRMLPAHVTVKGTFVEPTDLDEIAVRIGRACASPILRGSGVVPF